jgi:uncharacterized membrane protein YphA (DoxX/SURF4 family)
MQLPIEWVILKPSLVYGSGGTSAKLFTLLATLPFVPVPSSLAHPNGLLVQPIHLDDVIEAIAAVIDTAVPLHDSIELVGPAPTTFECFLFTLRRALNVAGTQAIGIPISMMTIAARIAALSSRSLLDPETLNMLLVGNTGDASTVTRILGRSPRGPESFIRDATAERILAKLQWLLPLMRYSIGIVWIVTGIISIFVFPVADSYQLLARAGVPASLSAAALYSAAVLDIALGIATFVVVKRRWVWWSQILTILIFTIIISIGLPEYWAHPYGPLLKNIPMLAAIVLLSQLEERQWTT